MPLIVPAVTLGGPADPKKKDFFQSWWTVISELEDEASFLQGQEHKCLYLPVLPFLPNPIEEMRKSRRNHGDLDTNPYRIIIKLAPFYYAVASSTEKEDILLDWDVLREMEQQLNPSLSPHQRAEELVRQVIQLRVASLPNENEDVHSISKQIDAIWSVRTFPALNTLVQSLPTTATNSPAQSLLVELLYLKANTLQQQHTNYVLASFDGDLDITPANTYVSNTQSSPTIRRASSVSSARMDISKSTDDDNDGDDVFVDAQVTMEAEVVAPPPPPQQQEVHAQEQSQLKRKRTIDLDEVVERVKETAEIKDLRYLRDIIIAQLHSLGDISIEAPSTASAAPIEPSPAPPSSAPSAPPPPPPPPMPDNWKPTIAATPRPQAAKQQQREILQQAAENPYPALLDALRRRFDSINGNSH